MEIHRVDSSAILSIGYDGATKRMQITFKQGHSYDYCRVPAHVFQAFLNARSKGSYYNSHIKDMYDCY